MDTAGVAFAGLTLASIITTGGLVINLTENFGTLANNGDVLREVDGERLVGTYGNAVTGMSAVVIALTGLYLIFYIFNFYRARGNRDISAQRVYLTVILLAVMLGLSSAAVNLNLTENFITLEADGNIAFDPAVPVAGENYKMRGTYGNATLGMAAASLSVAGLAWLWMMRLWWMGGTGVVAVGSDLGLVDMGSRRKPMLDFNTL